MSEYKGAHSSPNKCNVTSRACSRSGGFALPALALMWLNPHHPRKSEKNAREAARRAHHDAFGANRGAPWRNPTEGGG